MTPTRIENSTEPGFEPHEFPFEKAAGRPLMRLLAVVLPLLSIAVVYAQTRTHAFVWDDTLLSLGTVYSGCEFKTIFTTAANSFEYLPVRDLTLCVDHALFGESPAGFHFQNVLLFGVAVTLLGSLYRVIFAASPHERLARNARWFSLLVVMVFAMHPLQVEPVAFITARNALLALVFMLATLVSYARFVETNKRGWYGLSVILVAFALFSKATAIPVALLVVIFDFYLNRDAAITRSLLRGLPHIAITAAAAAIHIVIASTHGAMNTAPTIAEFIGRLPRAAFIPQFYFYKFAWPLNQSTEYIMTGVREQNALVALGTLVFALVCGAILFRGARMRSAGALLCAGYLVALIPILNLLPTYPPVADRYAQIPLVFLAPLVLLPALIWLPEKFLATASAVLVATLGWLSFQQVPTWKSDETIFAHAFEVDSRALVSLENLAHTHWYRGRPNESLVAFKKLAAERPSDGQYALFSAWHHTRQRDFAAAQESLGVARRMNVARYYVHMVQAEIFLAQENRSGAIRELKKAKADAARRFQRDSRARVYTMSINKALKQL